MQAARLYSGRRFLWKRHPNRGFPGWNLNLGLRGFSIGIGVVSALSLIDPLTRVREEKVNVNG